MAQDEKPNGGNDEFKKRYYQKAKLLTDAIPDGMDFNKFQEKLSTDESYRKGVHDELSVALENGLLKKLPTYDRVNELYGIQSQSFTPTFPTPDQLAIPVNQGEPVPTTGGQPVPTGQPVQPVQPVQPIDMPVGTIGSPVPELTPTGLPVLNPVQPQDNTGLSQDNTGLSQGQYQITDTTQIPQGKPVQPVIPPIPQMADTSAQVTSTSGLPATAEVPKDLTEVPNIPEALNTKLGEAESGFISGIGSELKGLSEAGYAIDSKIVKALEGTALEGAYRKLPKAEDSWIYQAGQSLQDLDKDFIYKNPKYEGGLSGTIATGLGNVASIMATGGFTPAGAIMRGGEIAGAKAILANGVKQFFSRSTIAGALQNVGFETDNARALHRMANSMDKDEYVLERASSGENPKDAEKAWDKLRSVSEDEVASAIIPTALASGGTEAIPLERLFMRISKPAQSILLNTLKTGGVQAFEEGIQEVIQQSIVNAGVGQTYNEAHKLTSGLGESAEGGAGTGFVLGTALSALMGKRAHIKQRVQNGELTVKEGIEELHDVQNAETHLQDKLTWAENLVSTVTDENVKKSMSDPKAETFFETNDAHITNPIVTMPKEVETVLDKIDGDILVSAEGLHSAYEWINKSFKETANNNLLSEAEKGATLNILSKMMGDIDKANESTREAETAHIENDLPVSNETSLPKGQNTGEKSIPPAEPLMKPISPIKQVIEIKESFTDKPVVEPTPATEPSVKPTEAVKAEEAPIAPVVEAPLVTEEVESTAKALEDESKNKPTIWEQVKQLVKGAVKKVGDKLGIISNQQHLSNFEKAKQEWDKLSPRDKKLKRADYELDDLEHTEGGYYKVGNSLIDLDLNTNHLKILLENNKFLNVLNKLGVTKIHGENRPAEEMFAHYSDNKIHLNNNSAFENIRQVTNAMSHELGHHEWTKLTKEERDYVRSLPLETGMAKHYEAQEKSGKVKETSASLQEENFADYVMQYFQGKLYGDEALLNKIPAKLRELFDNKYSDLLKDNEHTEASEAYHKAKADGSNPELVKAVEELLGTTTTTEVEPQQVQAQPEALADVESTAKALENERDSRLADIDDIHKEVLGDNPTDADIAKSDALKEKQKKAINDEYDKKVSDLSDNNKLKDEVKETGRKLQKATLINENVITDHIAELEQRIKNLREPDGSISDKNAAEAKNIRKAIEGLTINVLVHGVKDSKYEQRPNSEKAIAEAYHKAKADGSNPELVKAVEELLGKPTPTEAPVATGGQEVVEGVDTKFASEYGISVDDVNNLVEQKRKTFEGYTIEMALQKLGVPQDKIKDALPAYVAEMLEGTLPTKSPAKKQKIDEDLIPKGEIKIQPIESKGKGKPAKTTEEKIDLVSDATDTKSTRDYATVVHKNADNKEVVATDANVLIVIKDNSITETESVDVKTGQKRDVRYPDYKSVIPDTAKRKDKKKINAKTIYDLASGIAKATKMFTGRIILARITIGDTEVFLNAEKLKRGLEPFVRSGITDIEVSVDGFDRAVVFKGGDITSIVMPIRHEGEGAGYTTIISEKQATSQTTPTAETTATTIPTEVETVKPAFPTEINPADKARFTEFEAMPEAVKPNLLKALKKGSPEAHRAETEFTDLMGKAENQGLWNPETRTMSDGTSSIHLPTDSDAKAWLSQGGIKVVEGKPLTTEQKIAKLKDEAKELNKQFLKEMGKATSGISPDAVVIIAKLAWNKLQQAGHTTSAKIRDFINESIEELNNQLVSAGHKPIVLDKEDYTNIVNHVRKERDGLGIKPQIGQQVTNTTAPINSARTEDLSRRKIAKYKEGLEPEFKRASFKKWIKESINKLQQRITSPRKMLSYAEAEINRQNGTTMERNTPLGKRMEQLGANAKVKGAKYMEKLSELLKPIDKHLEDFEDYLTAKRILDRQSIDKENKENPDNKAKSRLTGGLTETDADVWLHDIEQKVGTVKFNEMVDAGDALQKLFDDNLKDLVKAGILTKERYDAIKSQNPFYVPFDVIQRDFKGALLSGKSSESKVAPNLKKIIGVQVPTTAANIDKTIKLFKTMLNKGDIDVDGYYYLANEYLHDAVDAGHITQSEYESKMDALADPKLELGSVLDRTQRIILASQYSVARQEYMKDVDKMVNADKAENLFHILKHGEKIGDNDAIFEYYKDGEKIRVATNKEIATAIDRSNKVELNALSRLAQKLSVPFRLGATTFNPSFIVSNMIMDSFRTITLSEAGIFRGRNNAEKTASLVQIPLMYTEALIESVAGNLFHSDFGKKLGLHKSNLISDYNNWKNSAAYTDQNINYEGADNLTPQEKKFHRDFAKNLSVLFSAEKSKALANAAIKTQEVGSKAYDKIMSVAQMLTQITEQSHKVFAQKRLSGIELGERRGIDKLLGGIIDRFAGGKKILTPVERANALEDMVSEIRNQAGSPDFENIPPEIRAVSVWVPFLAAAIKGNSTDISRLIGTEGGKNAKDKAVRARIGVVSTIAIPSFLSALVMGLSDDDDEQRKLVEQMPERNKNKNLVIPVNYHDKDGKEVKDLLTIPIRGVAVLISGIGRLMGEALASAINKNYTPDIIKETKETLINSLSEFNGFNISARSFEPQNEGKKKYSTELEERLQSTLSGVNPVLKFPLEVAVNKDLYTHMDVTPHNIKMKAQNGDIKPYDVKTKYTSPEAIAMSKALSEHGVNVWATTIDHFNKTFTADYIRRFDSDPKKIAENRLLWKKKLEQYENQGRKEPDNSSFVRQQLPR